MGDEYWFPSLVKSVRRDFLRSLPIIRIFGRDQGGAQYQPSGILKYVENLSRGLNADIGRKDFFEMASIMIPGGGPSVYCNAYRGEKGPVKQIF
jgi:hypothetical protein